MDEVLKLLSSLASDRVRHFELVKISNKALKGKAYVLVGDKGLHLATCNLSGLLKGGSFKYEYIKGVRREGKRVIVTLLKDTKPLEGSLEMETPCNTKLYNRIKVALGADHMLLNHRESESCLEDDSDCEEEKEKTLLPFKGYKKVVLNDYFFFVRDTFQHTSFTSGNLTRLQDHSRGFSINIHLREPGPIHFQELPPPKDLYQLSRGFLQEFTEGELLKDGPYNKRMNLNSDLAKWLCYHVLLKTETSLVAFFAFRRLYIPPMLDKCQDILIRFDVPMNDDLAPHLSTYYNEICTTANSITAVDQYILWYKDIIQVRLDNLRFSHPMYIFLKLHYGTVPSYYNLIKDFVFSVVRLLPRDRMDPQLLGRLKSPIGSTSDRPMDYVYTINALMFGVGDANESRERRVLMNKFNMRLSDFMALCFDELLLGSQLSLAILTRHLNELSEESTKETLYEVTAYLLHFRHKDFSKEYSTKMLQDIIASYLSEKSAFDWNTTVFNHYATSRMIEEGFFIHQYVEQLQKREYEWNPYINLLTDMIEQHHNEEILERLCRKFLDIPKPIDIGYMPLIKCLIGILRRQTSSYMITVMIISILTNFSFHASAFKDYMVKQGLPAILVDHMLSQEDKIVLATLKLMINLTKTPEQQKAFINLGVFSNFVSLLERYYGRNGAMVGYAAGVLGQLFNASNSRITEDQKNYILEVMLYAFHIGMPDPNMMVMIMFCLRKLPKTRNMYTKLGSHVIRSVIMNLQLYRDDDFVMNSLELLLDLTVRVQNCISMRKLSLMESLDTVPMNDTMIQIANKLKERILRRTRFLPD